MCVSIHTQYAFCCDYSASPTKVSMELAHQKMQSALVIELLLLVLVE